MISDWNFFFFIFQLPSHQIIYMYSNFTFLPLCDNRNALCFPIFGLYFYLCFVMHLLTPLRNFTSLILPSLCTADLSIFLNPSKWFFSICKYLPLKQNTCLLSNCSISPSTSMLIYSRSYLYLLSPS